MSHFLLQNQSGALLLDGTSGYYLLQFPISTYRVKAVAAGFYNGDFKDIGDVFDLVALNDFSDSSISQVPASDPDYPVYGWMESVPSSTPLFSWASSGLSSPRAMARRTVL